MGAVLEPTAAMGPFNCEARSESFYIGTHPDRLVLQAQRDGDGSYQVDGEPARFAVPLGVLVPFLEGLNQVAQDPNYHRWEDEGGDVRTFTDRAWTITREEDRVVVDGPVITFGAGREWAEVQSVEIGYRDLPDLMRWLAPIGVELIG